MDAERRKFCEETTKIIEEKTGLLLGAINRTSPADGDEIVARAVRTLIETRDLLLAEAVAYENENEEEKS